MEKGLSPRQEAFVNAYAATGFTNGTQAAIAAGYLEKNAHVTASRLLKNAKVNAAIAARRKPAQEAAQVDAAYVFARLRDVVESSMTRVPVLDMMGEHTYDAGGAPVFRLLDAPSANSALRTLVTALGMGREKADKDATIAALAGSLQEALGRVE